jgi:hypothetical protein
VILNLKYDENDDPTLYFDQEGIDYMIDGLMRLSEGPVGTRVGTPTVWEKSAPWWRFWNRKKDPRVGEFFLKRVDAWMVE